MSLRICSAASCVIYELDNIVDAMQFEKMMGGFCIKLSGSGTPKGDGDVMKWGSLGNTKVSWR